MPPLVLGEAVTHFCRPAPHVGRPFAPRQEAAIVPGLLRAAMGACQNDRRLFVIPEFHGPYGVADIATLETTDEALEGRHRLGIAPLLNQGDAAIVGCLPKRHSLHISTVSRVLGWQERHVAARVSVLCRRGILVQARSGSIARPVALTPLGRLSTYEAKVSDWQRGLIQASTYATWADRGALAIGRLPRDRTAVLSLAAELRLGLIVDGEWELAAADQRLKPQTRLWASEHAVAALAFGHHPSPAI
jgi:hypothetical protein